MITSRERYAEFKKATQILGVPESNLVFLGFPDGKLDNWTRPSSPWLYNHKLSNLIPSIIIYPDVQDANPDHSTIGKAVQKYWQQIPNK